MRSLYDSPALPEARAVPRGVGERARHMRVNACTWSRRRARTMGRLASKLAPLCIAGMATIGLVSALGSIRVQSNRDANDYDDHLRRLQIQLRALEQSPVWRPDYGLEFGDHSYRYELRVIDIAELSEVHEWASPPDEDASETATTGAGDDFELPCR